MSEPPVSESREPSRREKLRPWELIIGSLLLSVFTALVVLMGTRDFVLSLLSLGSTFIIALVGLSMFTLAIKPNENELADISEQDEKSV